MVIVRDAITWSLIASQSSSIPALSPCPETTAETGVYNQYLYNQHVRNKYARQEGNQYLSSNEVIHLK